MVAPPSNTAPKMAMIFSTLAVAAAPLFGVEAIPGPAAKGPEAGISEVFDEHGVGAEFGVLATSEGEETGGDATGDSVVPLGVAAMATSKGAEADEDATGDSVVAPLGVVAMGVCASEGAFAPARLGVTAMGVSACSGALYPAALDAADAGLISTARPKSEIQAFPLLSNKTLEDLIFPWASLGDLHEW